MIFLELARNRKVIDFGFLQPLTKTILSSPTIFSYTFAAYPISVLFIVSKSLTTLAPVAFANHNKSFSLTLLTVKILFLAKWFNARGSMPPREKITLAPDLVTN